MLLERSNANVHVTTIPTHCGHVNVAPGPARAEWLVDLPAALGELAVREDALLANLHARERGPRRFKNGWVKHNRVLIVHYARSNKIPAELLAGTA